MNTKQKLITAIVTASLLVSAYGIVSANSTAVKPQDVEMLAKGGIYLNMDSDFSSQVAAEMMPDLDGKLREAVERVAPGRLRKAKAVTIQRITYDHSLPSHGDSVAKVPLERRSGWLVTLDGLFISARGPSTVVNTQWNIVVDDDGNPIRGFTYQ